LVPLANALSTLPAQFSRRALAIDMKSARIGIKPLFASNDFGVRQTDQLLQYLFVVLAKKIGSSVSSANRHAVETPM
jgi:hypothetical protein